MPDAPSGTVTFLFTDIEGSTRLWEENPPAMRDALARHDAIVRDAITRHTGFVVKTTGDGFHAAFGSARDAVNGAIAAQRGLDGEAWGPTGPLSVRMGIHTGESYAREGDYYGQAPNRAARLMGLAHGGQILVSRSTEQLVRDALAERVSLIDVGEHRLRGLSRPERVFQVTHPDLFRSFPSLRALDASRENLLAELSIPFPSRLGVATAFAGRDGELALLDECWAEVQGGTGQIAFVAGEPGIGKTALVAQMAARVHSRGGTVLYGRCDEEFGVPYEPFVEALGQLVIHLPEPLLGAHVEEYGPHLAHITPSLRRYLRAADASSGADSDEQRFQLFASIAALLEMVGKASPIVLVLDDLHWADKPTVSLLRHIVGRAEPMRLLVAGTYRDSEVSAGHPFHDLLTLPLSPAAARITLAGLGEGELVAMLEQTAGHPMDETGIRLADTLGRDTGGNPFFVAELLRHLVETGDLYQDEGRWQLHGTIANLGLPDSAREVVGRRVAHLGTDAQSVLSAAAVIGQAFELPVLARVLGQLDDRVLDQLERAEQAALVRNISGDEFHFRHAIVQHALYEQLGSARRSRLHLRVAESLEVLGVAELRPEAAAHHLAASGRPDAVVKAIGYSRQAGDAALAALAPDQAAQHFRVALGLIDDAAGSDEQRCEVLISLGTALRQAGDGSHREVLLDAARLAERLGDSGRLVRAALANSRGWASRTGGVDEERIAVLEAALGSVGPADSAARARLLAVLASELTFSVDIDRRRALSDEGIAIARRLGDLPTLTLVLSSRFDAVRAPHFLEERQSAAAENVAVAKMLDDPMALWLAVTGRTQISIEAGDMVAADEALELEVQLTEELRQPYPRWLTTVHLSVRMFLAGRIDEAERLGTEAFQAGLDSGQPDAFPIYAGTLYSVWAAQGRLGELVPVLEEASADNPGIAGLRAALASAYCAANRLTDARAILTSDRDAGFTTIHLDGVWLSTLVIFAGVTAEVDDTKAAQELFELLIPFGSQFACDGAHVQGTVAQALGRLAAVLHEDDEADHWFSAAEELEGNANVVLMQAQTRVYWAEVLTQRGSARDRARARVLAEQARQVGLKLGCPPVAERSTRVLDAG